MGILEIIGGIVLIACSLAIILFVTLQTEHSDGISGAIMGNVSNVVAGKATSNEEKLAKLTKILAIVFFVVTLLVNIFALIAK